MQPPAPRSFTRGNKYRAVASFLDGERGTLLDVGARDRVLSSYLVPGAIDYRSADVASGQDYQIDLETDMPFDDCSFDIVVALDVLEHVDRIHRAFAELSRIAGRRLIIGLPNLGSIMRRWSFFLNGDLGTRKYDLLPDAESDRHRWLTVYSQMNEFVAVNARRRGMDIVHQIEQIEGGPVSGRVGLWASQAALLPAGFFVERCIYVIERIR